MTPNNNLITHPSCIHYDYGKTAPREYGAYCTKEGHMVGDGTCGTVDCGKCDVYINDSIKYGCDDSEVRSLKILNRDTGEYTVYKDVY